jgi:hypothetical protein
VPIILIRLTTHHIFGLQKQGRGHANVIYLVKYMDQPFRKSTPRNPFEAALSLHVRRSHRVVMSSSLVNRSTFMTTTKSRVMPPSNSFSEQSFHPAYILTVLLHRSLTRFDPQTRACILPYNDHRNTLNPSPRPVVLEARASQPRSISGSFHLPRGLRH